MNVVGTASTSAGKEDIGGLQVAVQNLGAGLTNPASTSHNMARTQTVLVRLQIHESTARKHKQ